MSQEVIVAVEAALAAGTGLDDLAIMLIEKRYDTGVFGGILIGGLTAWAFNRFFRVQLPEYLGFFSGKRAVPIVTGFLAIALALACCVISQPIIPI